MPYDVRMPDGTIIKNVPEGTTKADLQRRWQNHANSQKPTSFWQGVAEGVQKIAHNGQDILDAVNPVNYVLNPLARAVGLDPERATKAIRAREQQQFDRSQYRGSTAGRMTGEIAASLPVGLLPGGAMVQGAAGGVLASDNIRDPRQVATDAALGLVGGKVGDVVGRRLIAPVAERVGRTKPARAVASAAISALQKAGVNARPLPLPQFSTADRMVRKAAPQLEAVRGNLDDAARLNLPYTLADAAPELRSLGGSVARKSPEAGAMAEQVYGPRALGQVDRAVQAIDTHLAPITNIEQRAGQIRQQARAAAQPHYDAAMSLPAPDDPLINELLQTPAGKEAYNRALQIAANDGKDIAASPTFETLDYVKRGLDSVLNDNRNAFGNLNLEGDPVAASTNNLLQRFKGRLDELNPDYAQARQVYQQGIAPRTALQQGYEVLPKGNVPERQFSAAVDGLNERTLPEAQRGYATAMAEQADKVRLKANPYDAIYGSNLQQAKVDKLFPEGAADFNRVYGLEQDMSKTATETLGGSPTQRRAVADEMFDAMGPVADIAGNALTGGKLGVARAALRAISDAKRVGLGKAKADGLAPVLFNTDTRAALSYLDDLLRKQAEQQMRAEAYRRAGGLLGLPAALGAVTASQP